MVYYFINYSSNAHQVCCEDSLTKGLLLYIYDHCHQVCCLTKGLYDHCQSDDLDLHLRSQVLLKLDYFLTCISDNI